MACGDPVLRAVRAVCFAVVCVGVTAGGHAFAGGGAIGPGVAGAAMLGTLGVAYLVGGRELGARAVVGVTAGVQGLLHLLFSWAAPGVERVSEHLHLNVGMGMVHLVVGLLTGWWLYRGESALWLMLRIWGASIPVPRWLPAGAPVKVVTPLWTVTAFDEPAAGRTCDVAGGIARRGPPALGCTTSVIPS
ncbi:hypothetical protein Aph01nite_71160 [Acrocarpospora phusangensis]|uniref:Uncharacterized protein n=1 Tax=Acrocarpospora phusangensis TaxID=1070424 RepID=A0A919QJ65_9ACTN|nr:hypothetical protein [Acrocarpospora phusangensis]GIH28806.1 hypothetical protein Aph01nite_71160 [Acrocarpospora phusangensis]